MLGAMLLCLLLPVAVLPVTEGWSPAKSLYYAFITLSTIGFGDLVVGTVLTQNVALCSPDNMGHVRSMKLGGGGTGVDRTGKEHSSTVWYSLNWLVSMAPIAWTIL